MRVRVFRREGNNQYYFQLLRDDGQVILNSEGYTTEGARDNGVQSVVTNSGNPDRYETLTSEGGGFYFTIKAANGEELGRSITFRNAESRDAALALLQTEGPQVQGGITTDLDPYKPSGNEDDYKPLNFYESRITGVDDGFDSFSEGTEHYFTYNLGGAVYLISEGYESVGGRDNGIQSVTNNIGNADRYQRQQHPNGKFFFNLRAGNNREIATSRWFDSRDEMDTIIARMVAGIGLAGRRVEEGTQLEAANRDANIAIAAPPPPREVNEPRKKRKKRSTPKKPKAEKVYVANGAYHFNDVTWDIFRSGNGKYYFTFKNAEGKTLFLNSDVRGFETQEEAQAMVDQILLYAPYEANFEGKIARNGKYYFYIKGADDKNIGKSFFYGSAEDMQSAVGSLLGNELELAQMEENRKAAANTDDYLACSAYEAGTDGFHKFTHDDGEHYFSYVGDGKVRLRSEGYTSTSSRDNGIESVIKNAPIDERWKTLQDKGQWYYALRAGNNQEIARSCGYDSEAAMLGSWGWLSNSKSLMGAGALGLAAAAAARKKEEEAAALALSRKKEEAAAAAAAAAAVSRKREKERVVAAAGAASEGSGTMGWWPWLLLLPLLLAALWFSRGCYGCGDQPVVPPPMSYEVPVFTPPAPPAAVTCNCSGESDNAVFNLPTGRRAQVLTRLGTNPEFGEAHGLTGPKFLGRLRNRYATDNVDKKFLDDLFTAMGYENGFADAKATMFTETTIPNGKTGNMGYGASHGTTYTTLDARDSKDLEAFRVAAANGCDVYFMKTCGNHFYFCD